jgi:mycothiol synthase
MKHELVSGYTSRSAVDEDLEMVVELLNVYSNHMFGMDEFTAEEYRVEWDEPGFDLARDTRLVLNRQGELVAYYEFWDTQEPHVRFHAWGRIHPQVENSGVGMYLLDWIDERSALALKNALQGARVVLHGHILSIDQAVGELYQKSGYDLIRHSLRMVTEFKEPPPAPRWPKGISVRTFREGQEEREVFRADYEAFQDHWGFVEAPFEEEFERWLHHMKNRPNYDPSLWFLAVENQEIVGISLCRQGFSGDPEIGWVGTLGVRRPWRRRGVALALLQHSFGEFYRRGLRKAGLGVDASSLTGATRLYRKAGMRSDPAYQYDLYEKELRPGEDLLTQSLD